MAVPRIKTFANAGTLLPTDLNSIQDDYGARLDSVYVAGGFNADSVVRRGKSIIAATEVRANAAFGLMTTPDRVQNIVLPTSGLIAVLYQATWQESVSGQGSAAIFVGANQLQIASSASAPVTPSATTGSGTAATDNPLASYAGGLLSGRNAAYTADVTTGQAIGVSASNVFTSVLHSGQNTDSPTIPIGGPCYIFAAAGTYDVSVQFRANSGSVTVKNRKLWVWTVN